MIPALWDMLLGFAAALGSGLLIGIERERRKGKGPTRSLAGVRTFTLITVAGAGAKATGEVMLVYAGAALVVLLAAISYWRDRSGDPGVTTEVTLFVAYLLGVIAMGQPTLAAGSAVVVTALLASRGALHRFSVQVLTATELRDALLFCGAALVVLPLLPERIGWSPGGLNPRRLWSLVVVFMGLQAGGYIAMRAAGPRLGLALSGFASGFVSSTATVAALGLRARQHPELLWACVAGALFSSVTTVLLLFVVAITVDPAALQMLTPSLLTGLIVALGVALLSLRRQPAKAHYGEHRGRAFNLLHATGFAVILSVMTFLMTGAAHRFGQSAVFISATIGGFFDLHAAAASTLAMSSSVSIPRSALVIAVACAWSTNTVSKLVAGFGSGGVRYGLRVGAGVLAILAALWIPLLPALAELLQ